MLWVSSAILYSKQSSNIYQDRSALPEYHPLVCVNTAITSSASMSDDRKCTPVIQRVHNIYTHRSKWIMMWCPCSHLSSGSRRLPVPMMLDCSLCGLGPIYIRSNMLAMLRLHSRPRHSYSVSLLLWSLVHCHVSALSDHIYK